MSMLILVFLAADLSAVSIKGSVTTAEDGSALPGATVFLVGTKLGTRTNAEGVFEISNLYPGTYNVRATFTGYEPKTLSAVVKKDGSVSLEFTLIQSTVMTKAVEAIASRAVTRETPVAFSSIDKETLENKIGSRDIPMILNETPGVYATELGGGSGDSRINIRGFDQRNIAVMINGVPVNDMENGWVYWSNWAGLKEVTSSIQVQRGLGAGNLGNPSVGGTLNYTTDAASRKAGVTFRSEYGSGDYFKNTVIANTGKLANSFAATFVGSRTVADGVIDKTWTDAWAYYLGLSWDLNESHQLDFFLIGAPQQHGQRSYSDSVSAFSADYAADLGLDVTNAPNRGITYNPNWGYLNAEGSENVEIFYNGNTYSRRFDDVIMERENYFHKPQINLNWFWDINPVFNLTNVFYLSTGQGGGSGTYGDFYEYDENGQVDFNKIYEYNTSFEAVDPQYSQSERQSGTILRNSVNNHFWYGYLGTANYQVNRAFNLQFGLDARHYKGEHYQEIRSLLGGDYFINTSNRNEDNPIKRLGDKIAYYNDGLVTQIGGFATGEFKLKDMTIYMNTSLLNTGYQRIDYFRNERINGTYIPGPWETEVENFIGYTIKAGANYNINRNLNVFANAGYYARPPLFRNVFSNFNTVYQNVTNEKSTAFELGGSWWSKKFTLDANAYYARWVDRGWSTSSYFEDLQQYIDYNLQGLNAIHMGIELESQYRPTNWLKFKGTLSLGNWTYENDVKATFSPENDPTDERTTNLALDGVKVADQAQKSFSLSVNVTPVKRSYVNLTFKYFMDYYANFDPEDRVFDPSADVINRVQSWKLPNFGVLDLHLGYTLPLDLPIDIKLMGHVFNLLDEEYIADAYDNAVGANHDAQSARVWFGRPRTFNIGLEIKY